MQKRDTKKELRLLDSYFKRIKNSTVELVIFRNKIDSKETFHIKSGNWFNLKKRLLRVQYDGGTSLGQLDLTKFNCDEFILVSDGISNFGKSEIKLSNVPVITISSSLTAQHSYLRYISQKSGGVQINLAEITINNALRAMTTQPFSFIKATYNQGTISETYPSLPTVVHNDFSISGKIHTQSALITLHFGYAGKTLYTKKIWINQKRDAIKKEIVTRIWAQKKIYQLEMRPKKNELLITTLGKAHNIVTRFTSVIVLERLSDYVKYRIVPPSELQTAYYNAINRIAKSKRVKKISHLETIVKKFQRLQLWWQKRYPLDTPKIKISPKKSLRNGSTRRSAERRARRPVRTGDERDLNTISRSSNSAAGKNSKQKPKGNSSSITLKKWSPDTPYLRNLKKVSLKDMYNTYISLKKNYANSSAFYLDVADLFIAKNKRMLALRILSNIAEMKLENPQLLRILAHRLAQLKENKLSISVFKEVLGMRKEDPQSYRDLALVLSRDGQNQKAIELLYKVGTSKWDSRFPEIELIALNEMNSIIGRFPNLNTSTIDRRLIRHMPVDVRVVLNWDADNTDMDLWVFDPNKEKCYYAHRFTYQGGRMSRDFTRGYGPEVYMVRRAKDGNYTIKVNYYGNRQQIIAGATTVQMQLFLNYGRPNQTMKEITLRLKNKREVITVGSFKIRFGHK